jgi:hypothetical protein
MNPTIETNGRASAGLAVPMEELLRHISPEGALGLPRLLDEKRIQWGIPDEAFTHSQACFNKVLVWQTPLNTDATYEGTLILKPDSVQKRDRMEAPRGVIVSAGLQALDALRSHGVDLGHTVGFCRVAPFRKHFATIGGVQLSLIILHASEIIDSEDLNKAIRERRVRFRAEEHEGVMTHYYIDENGKRWHPVAPDSVEDN